MFENMRQLNIKDNFNGKISKHNCMCLGEVNIQRLGLCVGKQ